MLDDIRSNDDRGVNGSKRPSPPADERPLSDREVPISPPGGRRLADAVHAWLDGELPEAAVRRGDTARDVEFWLRINEAVEERRRVRTPSHVQDAIMEAIRH